MLKCVFVTENLSICQYIKVISMNNQDISDELRHFGLGKILSLLGSLVKSHTLAFRQYGRNDVNQVESQGTFSQKISTKSVLRNLVRNGVRFQQRCKEFLEISRRATFLEDTNTCDRFLTKLTHYSLVLLFYTP